MSTCGPLDLVGTGDGSVNVLLKCLCREHGWYQSSVCSPEMLMEAGTSDLLSAIDLNGI